MNLLGPFASWYEEALPNGYYLYSEPVQTAPTTRVRVKDRKTGQVRDLLNLASYNYLGISYRDEVKQAAIEAIHRYGLCSSIQCLVRCDSLILIGKVLRAETEMWVAVAPASQGSEYDLTLVKRETMQQDTSASRLFATIQRDGHAALYIQFVSRQSAIRADSQPLILQVTQMLEDHPDLRLSIEAHTDDAGTVESNRTLSAHRAAAVLSALVAQGIEAQRLIAVGRGQEQPIADNRTEEGRAKNRRIEFVKK